MLRGVRRLASPKFATKSGYFFIVERWQTKGGNISFVNLIEFHEGILIEKMVIMTIVNLKV
jgi:hypothetical protein